MQTLLSKLRLCHSRPRLKHSRAGSSGNQIENHGSPPKAFGDDKMNSRTGSVLICVLWSLFFLGTLAMVILAYVQPQIELAGRLRDRTKIYYLAKAGVRSAILEIEKDTVALYEGERGYDSFNEAWSNDAELFKEVEVEDGTFTITAEIFNAETDQGNVLYGLLDEERKININFASEAVLQKLFEAATGVTTPEAADMAAAIIDWRDPDDDPLENGVESEYYQALEAGYPCKNGLFEIPEELLLVRNITPGIFDMVKDHITIHSMGVVNINTAGKVVLQSLGLNEILAGKVISYRNGSDGQPGTEDDNIFDATGNIVGALRNGVGLNEEDVEQLNRVVGSGLFSVYSNTFKGVVSGRLNNHNISRHIIFIVDRTKNIKYWREF